MGSLRFSKFFPHERNVQETHEEIQVPVLEKEDYVFEDESKKTFWSYFDEYQYRKNKPPKLKYILRESDTSLERKLLLKLDILITFYSFLGYWVKFLDSTNLTNAYVSGMHQDLGMKGNDFVDTQIIYTIGATIFTIPFIYILPRFPAPYVLFTGEFVWSLFTLTTSFAPNLKAVKAFRFIVGAAETSFFPIVHYSLTSWFKPHEVSKRAGFFYIGQYLGVLTSGLLQGAIFDSLNGANGLSGWRWAYIIDSLISFVVCFIGLFATPGTPFKCYSLFLTDDEIKLGRRRMRENGSSDGLQINGIFERKTWKKMLTSWHFWIFAIGNVGGFNSSNSTSGSFALWLKSLGRYSVSRLNQLTAIPPALGIIWLIITTTGADITRKRFLMIVFAQAMNFISNILLVVWKLPERTKWFAFYFSYWAWSQSSVFYPLQNDILRHDVNLRSIEWVITYIIGLQSSAWIPKIIWKTVDAPRYHKGFLTAGLMGLVQALCMIIGYAFYKREERLKAERNGAIAYYSEEGKFPIKERPPNKLSTSEDKEKSTYQVGLGSFQSIG